MIFEISKVDRNFDDSKSQKTNTTVYDEKINTKKRDLKKNEKMKLKAISKKS
jgi:hypothetical protein